MASPEKHPSRIWDHSLRVAFSARRIARAQGFRQQSCERAFLAGLLHDVGRIVINANAPEEHAEVIDSAHRFRIPIAEAEQRRFGASHAQIGAYLLALWGIEEEVTSLVQNQETLATFDGEDPAAIAALHVAHFTEMNNAQNIRWIKKPSRNSATQKLNSGSPRPPWPRTRSHMMGSGK